jgi:hypothetical protein
MKKGPPLCGPLYFIVLHRYTVKMKQEHMPSSESGSIPSDHVMTQEENLLTHLDIHRAELLELIENFKDNGAEVDPALIRQLNDVTAFRNFREYIATLSLEEVKDAMEEFSANGYSNELLARLTPPDDFFIGGNETRQ